MYSPQQQDAILDVLEQCHLVTHTYEQQYKRLKDQVARKRYTKSVEKLTELFTEAVDLKVPSDVLTQLVAHHLPRDLSLSIDLPAA